MEEEIETGCQIWTTGEQTIDIEFEVGNFHQVIYHSGVTPGDGNEVDMSFGEESKENYYEHKWRCFVRLRNEKYRSVIKTLIKCVDFGIIEANGIVEKMYEVKPFPY